jgi:hypothetical protein
LRRPPDGATAVSDLLIEMKAKAVEASLSGLDASSQAALHEEFTALRSQIVTVVGTADFNGKNLIESGATNLSVLSSVEGSTIVVTAQPISTTSLGIHTAALDTASNATTAVTLISQAIVEVSSALTALGTSSRGLEIQQEFTTKLVGVMVGTENLAHAPAQLVELRDDRSGDAGIDDAAATTGSVVEQEDVVVAQELYDLDLDPCHCDPNVPPASRSGAKSPPGPPPRQPNGQSSRNRPCVNSAGPGGIRLDSTGLVGAKTSPCPDGNVTRRCAPA